MPITETNFILFSNELIKSVKELIVENHDDEFNNWLLMEAEIEVVRIYIDCFSRRYFGNIPEYAEDSLAINGRNIIYFIKTYTTLKADFTKLIEGVEIFIQAQLDNFDIDFDGLVNWISDAEDYDPC